MQSDIGPSHQKVFLLAVRLPAVQAAHQFLKPVGMPKHCMAEPCTRWTPCCVPCSVPTCSVPITHRSCDQQGLLRKQESQAKNASLLKVTLPLQCEQPINFIRVDGRSCTIRRSSEHYAAIESQSGMIPWNGKEDNLIDRFDGRALLDFYREPARTGTQNKSEDQQELDEVRQWQQAPAALSCCRGKAARQQAPGQAVLATTSP